MLKLPEKKQPILAVNPKILLMYAQQKVGKSTVVANLDDNLIIDLENSSDYLSAMRIQPKDLQELKDYGNLIAQTNEELGKNKYKYITIDTITVLVDFILPLARDLYRNTPMGKSFPHDGDILDLPKGSGWYYVRLAFFSVIKRFGSLCDNLILIAQIKDNVRSYKGTDVSVTEISLPGQMAGMMSSAADATMLLYRNTDGDVVANLKSNMKVTVGSRCPHLSDKEIILSHKEEDGSIKTYWDKIFLDEEKELLKVNKNEGLI